MIYQQCLAKANLKLFWVEILKPKGQQVFNQENKRLKHYCVHTDAGSKPNGLQKQMCGDRDGKEDMLIESVPDAPLGKDQVLCNSLSLLLCNSEVIPE